MVGEAGCAPARPLRTTAFEAVMSAVPSLAHYWRKCHESNVNKGISLYWFSRPGPAPHWGQHFHSDKYGEASR